jgi:site-specific DNA recombinase
VQGARCTARFAPAAALDALVWTDLCRVMADPALLTHELQRIHHGAWLPQALQDRQQTVRAAVAQLERQQERLLDAYLAEIISREEFARKRQEVLQTLNGLAAQLRQLDAQAAHQQDVAILAQGITAFCQRLQPTLDQLTFAQRRQLVELLIDRVIVTDDQVEIRYVVPTSPQGEQTPFCHLRLDYFAAQLLHVTGYGLAGNVGRATQNLDRALARPCSHVPDVLPYLGLRLKQLSESRSGLRAGILAIRGLDNSGHIPGCQRLSRGC